MRGRLLARPPTSDATNVVTPGDDDARLVGAAKVDPRAFAPLYSRYVDRVYRYCYRKIGEPEAAADATSLVFAKALAALPRYRDDARSFQSWLFAIAHNVLIDGARTRRVTTTLDAVADLAAATPSVEDQILAAEAGQTIRRLLLQLTPDQREVMELRLAGLTGPEIAAALDRSLGSVKIAQVRALARLRIASGLVVDPSEEAQ